MSQTSCVLSHNSKIGSSIKFGDDEYFIEFIDVPLFFKNDLGQLKVKDTR